LFAKEVKKSISNDLARLLGHGLTAERKRVRENTSGERDALYRREEFQKQRTKSRVSLMSDASSSNSDRNRTTSGWPARQSNAMREETKYKRKAESSFRARNFQVGFDNLGAWGAKKTRSKVQ